MASCIRALNLLSVQSSDFEIFSRPNEFINLNNEIFSPIYVMIFLYVALFFFRLSYMSHPHHNVKSVATVYINHIRKD